MGFSWINFIRVALVYMSVALLAPGAKANENTIEFDPSLAGQLVPKDETGIEVQKEYLDILFNGNLKQTSFLANMVGGGGGAVRVEVTARYYLHNTSWIPCELNLAFPIVRTGPEDKVEWVRTALASFSNNKIPEELRRGVNSRVSVDGWTIKHDYVSFERLFEKERARWAAGVRAWLKQHPELLAELEGTVPQIDNNAEQRLSRVLLRQNINWDLYMRIVWAIFPAPGDRAKCNLLKAMAQTQALYHRTIDDWDLDFLSFVYANLYPKEEDGVAKFLKLWGVEDQFLNGMKNRMQPNDYLTHLTSHSDVAATNHRIDFLNYHVKFWPRESHVVEVHYSHLMNAAIYPNEENRQGIGPANLQHFQYILRTSPKWKAFGPIYLTLSAQSDPKSNNPPIQPHTLIIPKGSEVHQNLHVAMSGAWRLEGQLIWAGPASMKEGSFTKEKVTTSYFWFFAKAGLTICLAGGVGVYYLRRRKRLLV